MNFVKVVFPPDESTSLLSVVQSIATSPCRTYCSYGLVNAAGWDVSNGVSRRAWSGSEKADITIRRAMQAHPDLLVTLPHHVQDSALLDTLF